MSVLIDLTGHRFGRLLVLEFAGRVRRRSLWACRCDCGATRTFQAGDLRSGHTTSCGCYKRALTSAIKGTHRLTGSPEYYVWSSMRQRCSNPRVHNYASYGGRGIVVCQEWSSFERFFADMGPRPTPQHTIDRIDNDGPYASWNCRWATRSVQNKNRRPQRRASAC